MIGIYGGTFDPVHYGHLRTAIEVKDIFSLAEIRLTPCALPAHRHSPDTAPEKRFDMLMLAIQNQADLVIDRRELDRPGVSFMIDTLKSTRNEMANEPLLLFMGTDAFKSIATWRQWQCLFDYAHIVVMTRPQHQSDAPLCEFLMSKYTKIKDELNSKPAGCLFFQPVTALDISATSIRKLIASGMSPSYLLPDTVIHYIKQNKLYV